jgi:hypothetical protein
MSLFIKKPGTYFFNHHNNWILEIPKQYVFFKKIIEEEQHVIRHINLKIIIKGYCAGHCLIDQM